MNYATLAAYIRPLFWSARHGWEMDADWRAWIQVKVTDFLTLAPLHALDEYRDHLAFDLRLDDVEAQRFRYWWAHIVEKGFNAGNPLSHLNRTKVGAK